MKIIQMKQEWLTTAEFIADQEIKAIKESLSAGSLKAPKFQTDQKENIMLGSIGEQAVKAWLKEKDIAFSDNCHVFGRSDEYDLKINNVKIDIKTNLRRLPIKDIIDTYQLLAHPEQVGKHGDIFLWVLCQGQNVRSITSIAIIGWLRCKEIKNRKLEHSGIAPCYKVPINEVKQLEEIEWIE